MLYDLFLTSAQLQTFLASLGAEAFVAIQVRTDRTVI